MATKATIRQNRYDKTHMRQYLLKMHMEYDKDIIQKLASVPSMQGYIKQLIRDDISRTHNESDRVKVYVHGKTDTPQPEEVVNTCIAIANNYGIDLYQELSRTRTDSVLKTEMEEKHMMYHIKPEYLDMWEGGDTPSNPDRIITEEDLRTFSEEWETPIETLIEQLVPIE